MDEERKLRDARYLHKRLLLLQAAKEKAALRKFASKITAVPEQVMRYT